MLGKLRAEINSYKPRKEITINHQITYYNTLISNYHEPEKQRLEILTSSSQAKQKSPKQYMHV